MGDTPPAPSHLRKGEGGEMKMGNAHLLESVLWMNGAYLSKENKNHAAKARAVHLQEALQYLYP